MLGGAILGGSEGYVLGHFLLRVEVPQGGIGWDKMEWGVEWGWWMGIVLWVLRRCEVAGNIFMKFR